MRKAQFLKHWSAQRGKDGPIKITAIPYSHKGSTFAEDGIRITGSADFIDSVLARLTDLLAHENGQTRLQVSHQESTDRETGQATGSFQCYIQVRERGRQARIANALAE